MFHSKYVPSRWTRRQFMQFRPQPTHRSSPKLGGHLTSNGRCNSENHSDNTSISLAPMNNHQLENKRCTTRSSYVHRQRSTAQPSVFSLVAAWRIPDHHCVACKSVSNQEQPATPDCALNPSRGSASPNVGRTTSRSLFHSKSSFSHK